MTQVTLSRESEALPPQPSERSFAALLRSLDVDTRLIGMVVALAVIWIGFQIGSGGLFLTSRNLWNLSVQSASIAIMACGMVLIIVTLGGFLVWRGLIFAYAQGQTLGPMDGTFALLGGGPNGSLGEIGSWVVGILGCVGIIFTVVSSRRRRQAYGFPVRPIWALA